MYMFLFLFIYLFIFNRTSYLYIEGGSTLLRSMDGERSLNISIEKSMPLTLFDDDE